MSKVTEILQNRVTVILFRWILGGLFIYASLHKIIETETVARDIQNYKLVPYAVTNLMATILPWIEFLAGLFLITGTMLRGSAAILTALLFMFIIAIAISLARGLNIHCGCYELAGTTESVNANEVRVEMIWHIFENIILMGMGQVIILFGEKSAIGIYLTNLQAGKNAATNKKTFVK